MTDTVTNALPSGKIYSKQSEQLFCPICQQPVDMLLGEDVGGGRQGCEICWRPPTEKKSPLAAPGAPLPMAVPVAAVEPPEVPIPAGLDPNQPAPATDNLAIPEPGTEDPAFSQFLGKLRSEVKADAK
ncbi:MAG: hypothetical protein U1D67_00675 [Dehalococcoidia bacterium]|nr:hypothetical protein [Dehalococcoidia bacterium]